MNRTTWYLAFSMKRWSARIAAPFLERQFEDCVIYGIGYLNDSDLIAAAEASPWVPPKSRK